ncbi:MAG TPA: UDP-N-acetylmuramate dehydrogenase [Acidimicrobiales bacterium]|nr:UDP-N-acetylmuramate dehydrogenase [Acidimicrobiales bacterium]
MNDIEARAIDVAESVLGPLARRDVPLGARTTYRVGGAAALFVEIVDEADLPTLVDALAASGADVLVVGKGSNLLVADRGFPGVAVCLGEHFSSVVVTDGEVEAGGATPLPVLARRSASAGAVGLEWAVGIPGSVGGAVVMNAGGHGAETIDRLIDARVLRLGDAREETLDAAALGLRYRHSDLGPSDLVLSANFAVDAGDRVEADAEISRIVAWRRANQPGGRNGGSVFTNPAGDSAGRLIEAAGLKGLRIGSATVSEKHANFIQVDEAGSADDVARLIEEVRAKVADRIGVTLNTELRLIGFSS